MCRHLVGNLVGFIEMDQCMCFYTVVFCQAHYHGALTLYIGMAGNKAPLLKHIGYRLQFEVAAGCYLPCPFGGFKCIPGLPFIIVFECPLVCISYYMLSTHPCIWETVS